MTSSAHTRVNSDRGTLSGIRTARVRPGQPKVSWQACLVCSLALVVSGPSFADVRPQTMNGPPLLPIPSLRGGGPSDVRHARGHFTVYAKHTPGNGSPGPGGGGSTGGGGGDGSDSRSMTSMMSRSWSEAASQNAQAVGVTSVSVAVTCQIEAGGCQTVSASEQIDVHGIVKGSLKPALAINP